MTLHEARMSPHDDTVHRLTLLLADAITGDAQARGSDDYAQREGPGRVLATVDDREYLITVAPNAEQVITSSVPPSQLLHRQRELLQLAMEYYVPVPIPPLAHVVVRRERPGVDLWAVTDGAVDAQRVWLDGRWWALWDVGRAVAFCWPLDAAMGHAQDAAEAEAREWRERLGEAT